MNCLSTLSFSKLMIWCISLSYKTKYVHLGFLGKCDNILIIFRILQNKKLLIYQKSNQRLFYNNLVKRWLHYLSFISSWKHLNKCYYFTHLFNTAVCLWTYVKAFCRATMKSGFPPLKTSLALDWTHTHVPLLASSLKTVKPLSPVFITGYKERVTSVYPSTFNVLVSLLNGLFCVIFNTTEAVRLM